MKLMFIIVRDSDSDSMVQTLLDGGQRVTRVASTGGFLHRGNATLMSGVEDDQVQTVIDNLRQNSDRTDDAFHRATIFVVDMPYFEQI